MEIIILVVIYLLSLWECIHWFRIAYSKHGTWSGLTPDGGTLLFAFFPMLNTGLAIALIFYNPWDELHEPTFLQRIARRLFGSKDN